MHNLSLGILQQLKGCAMERLRDEALSTAALSVNGQTTSFRSVKRKILSFLNLFLVSVDPESVGYKLRLNFSKTAVSSKLVGLFRESGLAGMLETNEYASIDMSLLF